MDSIKEFQIELPLFIRPDLYTDLRKNLNSDVRPLDLKPYFKYRISANQKKIQVYKSKRVSNLLNNNYIAYESNSDKIRNLPLDE